MTGCFNTSCTNLCALIAVTQYFSVAVFTSTIGWIISMRATDDAVCWLEWACLTVCGAY